MQEVYSLILLNFKINYIDNHDKSFKKKTNLPYSLSFGIEQPQTLKMMLDKALSVTSNSLTLNKFHFLSWLNKTIQWSLQLLLPSSFDVIFLLDEHKLYSVLFIPPA